MSGPLELVSSGAKETTVRRDVLVIGVQAWERQAGGPIPADLLILACRADSWTRGQVQADLTELVRTGRLGRVVVDQVVHYRTVTP